MASQRRFQFRLVTLFMLTAAVAVAAVVCASCLELVVAVLCLAPAAVGVYCLCRAQSKIGWTFSLVGTVLVLLIWPVLFAMANLMWCQFDLALGLRTTAEHRTDKLQIVYIQIPTDDFYDAYFKITNERGQTVQIMSELEGNKCWKIRTVERDNRVYFTNGLGYIGDSTPYIDLKRRLIFSGGTFKKTHPLQGLDFRSGWQ